MKYKLRPPQQQVYDKIKIEIGKGNNKILAHLPTAFGKTILALEIAKNALEKNNRVLFTCHRIQLAQQTAEKFKSLKPSYLQGAADGYNKKSLLTVATLQTLINRDIPEPKIVIIDEVHYAYESKLVQSLFERFPNAIFIGLSATPVDDRGYLLEGFDAIIDDFQTADLIALKWLVPFAVYSPIKLDLSSVKLQGNDYKQDELLDVIDKPDINNSIVENYLKIARGKKFICFAINKIHAFDLQKVFVKNNVNVEVITADTPEAERLTILQNLKIGFIDGIINIMILTAGFDEPSLECVILACPTKSWTKYIQCCGRGIRLHEGKTECILLDCAGAVEEHGMPDERRKFIFGKKISRVIDRELNIDTDNENRNKIVISEEKQVFLKRIGSLLDLYDGKIYNKEAELQEDVNSFLNKTDYFWWRQNSGKMYKDGRWVHFASKSGLPDNTVFYKDTSVYFGLELKLKTGRLTPHQTQTLPEMMQRGVIFFICESVFDVFLAIKHIEENVIIEENHTIIKNSIKNLPDWQLKLRQRIKL